MLAILSTAFNRSTLLRIACTTLILGFICCKKIESLYKPLAAYAHKQMEELYGAQPLSSEHESFVQSIATEMGINTPIVMRVMNQNGMALFGYYNAMAASHLFFRIIPLVDTRYLFISEGFFKDFTQKEQRFLIGHELIHIQYEHARYLELVLMLMLIFFFIIWRKYIRSYLQKYTILIQLLVSMIYFIGLVTLPGLAYRRHIEWEADRISLQRLGTHEGAIQLTERWIREYKLPAENPYGNLLSDHPSLADRHAYYVAERNQINEKKIIS